jgi:hypothetical protein
VRPGRRVGNVRTTLPRIIGQARGRPAVPRAGQILDELGVVDCEDYVVALRASLDERRVREGRADRLDPAGNLGCRCAYSDEDLVARVVQEAVIRPDDRQRNHRMTLSSERLAGARLAPATAGRGTVGWAGLPSTKDRGLKQRTT